MNIKNTIILALLIGAPIVASEMQDWLGYDDRPVPSKLIKLSK